jgi:phosphatidylserine decarboxylase
MHARSLQVKMEEIRQALRIHGGISSLCAAALAIRLSGVEIPSRRLRLLLYKTIFGKKYPPLDESELDRPLWAYRSLGALFARGVRPELRPISEAANQFLCPCDSQIQDVGRIELDRLITVKGVTYTLDSLLPRLDSRRFHGGHFGIFFLSPRDCHRVVSPQKARIEEVLHVPGSRLLVHPPFQRPEYPVFALNERVILRLATPLGACVLVLVAGWGVGNISLRFDPAFLPRPRSVTRKTYPEPVVVRRGEWIATFGLGSTVILITEPANFVTTHVARDEKVKYGQPVFTFGMAEH